MRNKFDNYYYWENIVIKDKCDNPFANEPISKESVFFHGVIVNCDGQSFERWLHFPTIEALVGYLFYIFVPTAFYIFLMDKNTIVFPQAHLNEMLDIMWASEKCGKKELIPTMREFSHRLELLWNFNGEKCMDEVKRLSIMYGERWNTELRLFSYFNVFISPLELGKYMVDAYESSEETDVFMLEDQLEVSKEEWLNICSTVYENDFMKRKFSEILNNKISDML